MSENALDGLLQHFRKTGAVQCCRELSDRELLERFVELGDEAAFTVLIERLGPMVLGVCRRALANFHDAEDACQATFLVLARNAKSVRKHASLSSWLHGVACRVAASLKRDQARRRSRERSQDLRAQIDPAAEVSWREVQAILDEELESLPERYRAPITLCYLECRTRDEAAKQLGLSPTTLHGRLERGRDLLRARLAKRGLTLGAVVFAAYLAEGSSQAALSPAFVRSSIKAAILFASGQPLSKKVVGSRVVAVTQEVLKTMFIAKLKVGSVAVLCASMFATMLVGSLNSLTNAQEVRPEAIQDPTVNPQLGSLTAKQVKTEKCSETLVLDSVDLTNGTLEGRTMVTDPERTFSSFRGEPWEVLVKPTTTIMIDGHEAKLADLQNIKPPSNGWERIIQVDAELEVAGDPKQIKRKGRAVRIGATGIVRRGVVQAINADKNTVTYKKSGRTMTGEVVVLDTPEEVLFAKDVKVTINDRTMPLSDLKPKMNVLLQMSAVKELVLEIDAYGSTVKGVLRAIDPAKNTVSVAIPSIQMTAEGVQVADYAKVVIDGKESKLSDLKAGMPVTLRMCAEPEQSTIIAITNEKTP